MASPRRRLNLDLTDPAFNPIYELAYRSYPGQASGPGAVTRELILVALGADPFNAARESARRKAYFDAVVRLRTMLAEAVTEISKKLAAEAAASEAYAKAISEHPELQPEEAA